MKVALVGNPNCGKTTLFNALTGMRQKVGNWTGVTVEKKSGFMLNDREVEIVDLPGTYSLESFSPEEAVTERFLENERPDCIINVADATNLERSLYLTAQLISKKIPVVVALNMADRLKVSGLDIDAEKLSERLGVDAVEVSARKKTGFAELTAAVKRKTPPRKEIVTPSELKSQERVYKAVSALLNGVIVKKPAKSSQITAVIDKIVCNKFLAFPIFALFIYLMYFVSIQTVGRFMSSRVEWFIADFLGGAAGEFLTARGASEWAVSLVVDGALSGVGAVLAFLPQVVTLYAFIAVLEGCGYMARVAFIMDAVFKSAGLTGKSFVPMIVGCSCSVPAITSARTIENPEERSLTVTLAPFIPCSAKLPLFALLAGTFFPENPFIAPSMYLIGITAVILIGSFYNAFFRKGGESCFIMEMPQYRLPKIRSVLLELWDKVKSFLIKTSTVILAASIVMWALNYFDFSFNRASLGTSILAEIGKAVAPVFAPLGFGNWQAVASAIAGIAAKENIVATLGVLSGNGAVETVFTPQSALSFMTFILLSSPCVAALHAMRVELGGIKPFLKAVAIQFSTAYAAAFLIYRLSLAYAANAKYFLIIVAIATVITVIVIIMRYIVRRVRLRRKTETAKSSFYSKAEKS